MGMQRKQWANFRYDQRWNQSEDFIQLMRDLWMSSGTRSKTIMTEKIKQCKKIISKRKRSSKSNSAIRIQELEGQIDLATRHIPFDQQEYNRLRRELNQEYRKEEEFWKQKSRIWWLKARDRNTRFFNGATKK